MNHSLSPASIGGRTRRRRGGVDPVIQVVGGRKQRGGEGEDGEVVEQQIGGGYMMPKQRGGADGAVEPVKGDSMAVNYADQRIGETTGGRKQRRRQTRRQSRRQARRQRKGGEKKSRSKSRSKSRQRR